MDGLLYLNVFLVINALIIFLTFGFKIIEERKAWEYFIKVYLFTVLILFAMQIILGVYFYSFFDYETSIITTILMFIVFYLLVKVYYKDLEKRFSYTFAILILVSSLFIGLFVFYTPEYTAPTGTVNSTIVLIFLLIATILPIIVMVGTNYLIKKKRKAIITEKELKYLFNYFLIAILVFFIFAMVSYTFIYGGQTDLTEGSEQNIELDNVGDIISAIFNSIIFDGFFIISMIFVLFGSVIRVMGTPAYRIFGSMVIAFLPMILWLTYWFSPPPQIVLDLFGDFAWFGKFFYIIIATMIIVIFLSGFTLFSNIVAVTG